MRRAVSVFGAAVIVMTMTLFATAGSAEAVADTPETRFACRLSGGVSLSPLSPGDVAIEAAVGYRDLTFAALAELVSFPLLTPVVEAEIGFARDWLTLSAQMRHDALFAEFGSALIARGTPPAWTLYTGEPLVSAGVAIEGRAAGTGELTLQVSPYLTALTTHVSDVLISGGLGIDWLATSAGSPSVTTTSQWKLSIDAGIVRVGSTTTFAGTLSEFTTETISLTFPEIGLEWTGTVRASPAGGALTYSLGLSCVLGDLSLLPGQRSLNASDCSGGICYGP